MSIYTSKYYVTVENKLVSTEALQKHLPELENLGYADFVKYIFNNILYSEMLPGKRRNNVPLKNYLTGVDVTSEQTLREAIYRFMSDNL